MMDLLYYDEHYKVVACLTCRYAVAGCLATHLVTNHKNETTAKERRRCADYYAAKLVTHPAVINKLRISSESPPIPYLACYTDGRICRLCPTQQPSIYRSADSIRRHLKRDHSWQSGNKGGRPLGAGKDHMPLIAKLTISPICCQTFYQCGGLVRFFQVTPASAVPRALTGIAPRPLTIREQIDFDLAQRFRILEQGSAASGLAAPQAAEVSPWLELTRWPEYLRGRDLEAAAHLLDLPTQRKTFVTADLERSSGLRYNEVAEKQLACILESLDRLVDQARESIAQEKVNIFDQHKVNSFVRRRSYKRPLLTRLKPSTYIGYKLVFKRQLCWFIRTIHWSEQPALHCVPTYEQSTALDHLMQAAQMMLAIRAQEQGEQPLDAHGEEISFDRQELSHESVQQTLDQACLQLCIALLNHRLLGKIYDSPVVGFLAVLGIDKAQKKGFQEATTFTSSLSGFLKIAQLLVVQRAVIAAETSETEFPAEVLEEMCDRFMVFESRSPIHWVLKLRSYGKQIRESTTSLGSLIWSDDNEKLSYIDLELTMTQLRQFVRQQVDYAQAELQALLFISAIEERDDIVPYLPLKELKDNPAIGEPGWSFLKDARNLSLIGYERWLLDRVLNDDSLRESFLQGRRWRSRAVAEYKAKVAAFLERLLLLAHITSGQPARGTELLGIQWCHTTNGLRRNVFVENGLVSFVTYYHKGYSVSGSVKIIHRYLPPEISELVVYYLWLVPSFCEQITLLASPLRDIQPCASPFLWSQPEKAEPWPTSRLTSNMQLEFWNGLKNEGEHPHLAACGNRYITAAPPASEIFTRTTILNQLRIGPMSSALMVACVRV